MDIDDEDEVVDVNIVLDEHEQIDDETEQYVEIVDLMHQITDDEVDDLDMDHDIQV